VQAVGAALTFLSIQGDVRVFDVDIRDRVGLLDQGLAIDAIHAHGFQDEPHRGIADHVEGRPLPTVGLDDLGALVGSSIASMIYQDSTGTDAVGLWRGFFDLVTIS
jgi:hypothetical protein